MTRKQIEQLDHKVNKIIRWLLIAYAIFLPLYVVWEIFNKLKT